MALMLGGCVRNVPAGGASLGGPGNPIVTIGAGTVTFPHVTANASYVIDQAAQTCWFAVSIRPVPLDCCAARRAPGVAEHVTWETDASCASPGAPAPAASPPE